MALAGSMCAPRTHSGNGASSAKLPPGSSGCCKAARKFKQDDKAVFQDGLFHLETTAAFAARHRCATTPLT